MLRSFYVWPVAFLTLGMAACETQDPGLPASLPAPSAAVSQPARDRETAAVREPWGDAAERGVTFRAVGNEPGWLLEIAPKGLRLVTRYGTDSLHADALERAETGDTLRFATDADGHVVLVEAVRKPCEDVMSGERLDYAVRVDVDESAFTGCGRSL